MLVNRYKLTSIISGKVIIGTRRELEKMGFVPDYVNTLTYTGYLYAQEWRCERMDKVEQSRKKTKPKKKKADFGRYCAYGKGCRYALWGLCSTA